MSSDATLPKSKIRPTKKEQWQKWYAKNKAKVRERERRYRRENAHIIKPIKRREYLKNADKYRLSSANRYERKKTEILAYGEKRRQERLDWLVDYCETHGCKACGEKDVRALDFHHRDPLTKYKCVSGLWCASWKRIHDEIEKCDVLCANCHIKAELALAVRRVARKSGKHLRLLRKIKETRGCVDCRMQEVACLQFHHWDRSRKQCNVMTLVNRPLRIIAVELAKCEVLCANCHRRRHARRGRRR